MIKPFSFLLVIMTLLSCDPRGDYQYWIENNTKNTLTLEYKELYNDSVIIKAIKPNDRTLIKEYFSINGLHDYGDNFLNRYFDEFLIYTDSTDKMKIDFSNRSNWNYETNVTGCFGRCGVNIYTIEIKTTYNTM